MLIVTKVDDHYECVKESDIGMCIVGRGGSPAEAVGDWFIYYGLDSVKCDPPELLEEFYVGPKPFRGSREREDSGDGGG